MNYYPDTNEFPEEIIRILHPLQHKILFQTWVYKMLRHCFDKWDSVPNLDEPYSRATGKLFIERVTQGDYSFYRLLIEVVGIIPIDVTNMPGAPVELDIPQAEYSSGFSFGDTFDLDIYAESKQLYIAPSTNTTMFLEQTSFEEIAENLWYKVAARNKWIEEIQIAPAETYTTPFFHTDNVDELLKYEYDLRIKPLRGPSHGIDAFRKENGAWIIKTPLQSRIENGYEIRESDMELMLSYALSNKNLLIKKDDPCMRFSAKAFAISQANGITRMMDLRHHAKIDLAKE